MARTCDIRKLFTMNMSSYNLNLHHYEGDLSPFGRRVLKVLINRWNKEREHLINVSNRQQQRFYRPSRVLTFDDANILSSLPPPSPPLAIHATHGLHHHMHSDDSPQTPSMSAVPTSGRMISAVREVLGQTGSVTNVTWGRMGEVSSQCLITAVPRTSPMEWQHMFDPQLLHEIDSAPFSLQKLAPPSQVQTPPKLHEKLSTLQRNARPLLQTPLSTLQQHCEEIHSPMQKTSHKVNHEEPIQDGRPIGVKEIQPVTKDRPCTIGKEAGVTKVPKASRKVHSKVTKAISKKVKRPEGAPKNPFRKEKYTKQVTRWLKGVESTLPVETLIGTVGLELETPRAAAGDQLDGEETACAAIAIAKQVTTLVPRKRKVKEYESPVNKVVQSRLTNIGGVMKFGKQNATGGNNMDVTDATSGIVVKHVDKEAAVKKSKKKFVAPLKSQPTQPSGCSGQTLVTTSGVVVPSDLISNE